MSARPHAVKGVRPSAVIEITSRDDETYDNFVFYAEIGVRDIWIVDRDSRQPKVFCSADNGCLPAPSEFGWSSPEYGAELSVDAEQQQLLIRCTEDASTMRTIP